MQINPAFQGVSVVILHTVILLENISALLFHITIIINQFSLNNSIQI